MKKLLLKTANNIEFYELENDNFEIAKDGIKVATFYDVKAFERYNTIEFHLEQCSKINRKLLADLKKRETKIEKKLKEEREEIKNDRKNLENIRQTIYEYLGY